MRNHRAVTKARKCRTEPTTEYEWRFTRPCDQCKLRLPVGQFRKGQKACKTCQKKKIERGEKGSKAKPAVLVRQPPHVLDGILGQAIKVGKYCILAMNKKLQWGAYFSELQKMRELKSGFNPITCEVISNAVTTGSAVQEGH